MSQAPQNIRALQEQQSLELQWPDDSEVGVYRFPYRFLRGRCCCAVCVDEDTGRRLVDIEDISTDIGLQGMSFSGNYALKINWSDGHNTGLYTWDYLAKLRDSESVTVVDNPE